MTIKDSLYFIYDGVKSQDMHLVNVNVSSGMQEEPFVHSRSIEEEEIRGRSKPYFKNVTKSPLEFIVSFAFVESWDKESLQKTKRWLTEQDYYKPLIFSNNPEKIYYALVVDDPVLVHNGLNEGYVNLKFKCNDAYAYSPLTLSKEYVWDEVPFSVKENSFTTGARNGLKLNSNNKLILNPAKVTWSDFSLKKWTDL